MEMENAWSHDNLVSFENVQLPSKYSSVSLYLNGSLGFQESSQPDKCPLYSGKSFDLLGFAFPFFINTVVFGYHFITSRPSGYFFSVHVFSLTIMCICII